MIQRWELLKDGPMHEIKRANRLVYDWNMGTVERRRRTNAWVERQRGHMGDLSSIGNPDFHPPLTGFFVSVWPFCPVCVSVCVCVFG